MLRDHASIVRFVAQAQGITGRKKLQKMMYIAKKLGYPVHEKYEFHMYGPYSEELTARIEELCTMGFLSEQKEDKGAYRVQPPPKPFSIRSESRVNNKEKGRNQKLKLFNLGNTISGAAS